MRKVSVIFVLLLSWLFVTSVSADVPAPGGPFQTAFNVQNLSFSQSANCTANFYNASGNLALAIPQFTVSAGDKKEFFTGSTTFNAMASGQYSGVVSCDQPVAAVVNFSDGNSGASHSGLGSTQIGTSFSAPGIYNNYFGFYSNIIVQNTTGSPINVTVQIKAPGGAVVSTINKTNIPAYASVSIDQSTDTKLSKNVPYSAVITGTGDIASVVNIYGTGSFNEQLYSYNPFSSGSTLAYAPIIMNNYYGYNTALTVQNVHASTTASVKVTYSNGQFETKDIAAGSSHVFLSAGNSKIPAGNTLYNAKIESTNSIPVVALVNQSNNKNRAASYTAFSTGSIDISIPIVLRAYYGFDSSVACQNLSSSTSATVTIDYAGVASNKVLTIPAGKTNSVVQLFDTTLNGVSKNWISSAHVTSTQPIVCVINQDIITGSGANKSQDVLQSYEGIGN
jgi:hypothetical protein